jgi:hypothetical protein
MIDYVGDGQTGETTTTNHGTNTRYQHSPRGECGPNCTRPFVRSPDRHPQEPKPNTAPTSHTHTHTQSKPPLSPPLEPPTPSPPTPTTPPARPFPPPRFRSRFRSSSSSRRRRRRPPHMLQRRLHIIHLPLLLRRLLVPFLPVRRQGQRGGLEPPRDLAVHAQPRVQLCRVPLLDLVFGVCFGFVLAGR